LKESRLHYTVLLEYVIRTGVGAIVIGGFIGGFVCTWMISFLIDDAHTTYLTSCSVDGMVASLSFGSQEGSQRKSE